MEDFLMSAKETEKYAILRRYELGEIKLSDAALQLQLSYRHTKRLWRLYKMQGKQGLISKKRGVPSPKAFSTQFKSKIINEIAECYSEYGPTLISEKLKEKEGIHVSREFVRKLMINQGLWTAKKDKRRCHPRRERRPCFGELIQLDGSHHRWFGKDLPTCTLLAAIDDATSKILWARFEEAESTSGYFRWAYEYFTKYGLPISLYVDQYSVFKVNTGTKPAATTQFKRALDELEVNLIYARSPQAKGRVERAFRTLQDRLVKELDLRKIRSLEEANAFLFQYIEEYNSRFGHEPRSSFNAHRSLKQETDLKKILCEKHTRQVTKSLDVSYKGEIYQIQAVNMQNRLQKSKVQIIETLNGEIFIEQKGKTLEYKKWSENYYEIVIDSKELVAKWERSVKPKKVKKRHPWKQSPRPPTFNPAA
jgi:hypothetical protein